MLRVGLTGGIATGKTTVGKMFVDLGCHLLESDEIVHELFEPGQAVRDGVVAAFGPEVAGPDGAIDRKVLGEIVFNNAELRHKLNSLVHPAVIQRQREWLHELETRDRRAIGIVSAALMVEVGTYKNYDKLIVVTCISDEQRRRLTGRSTLSPEQIEARISSQMPLSEKVKFADYVIENSDGLEATRSQVEEVYAKLLQFTE
ncbi:MAG: dephospho-CoA kinase [Acidobacteria bacterium]|nr:dephospho-CoA kinase [Acidobacteriota bacterium]